MTSPTTPDTVILAIIRRISSGETRHAACYSEGCVERELDAALRRSVDLREAYAESRKCAQILRSPGTSALMRQIADAGLPPPEIEYRPCEDRLWRLDLAWPDRLIAVEVHGATWSGGRHTRGDGFHRDCEKMAELQLRGWCVLPCTTAQAKNGTVLAWLRRAIEARP